MGFSLRNERDLFEPKGLDVIAQGVRTRSSSNSVFAAARDRSRGRSRCFLNGTTSRTRSSSNSVFAAARDRAEEAAAAQIAAAALAQEQKNEAALAERLERRVEEIVAARRAAIHEARCRVEEIIAARRAAFHEAHRRVEEIVAARRAAIDEAYRAEEQRARDSGRALASLYERERAAAATTTSNRSFESELEFQPSLSPFRGGENTYVLIVNKGTVLPNIDAPGEETMSGGPTPMSLFCPTGGGRVLGRGSYTKSSDNVYGSHDGSVGKKTVLLNLSRGFEPCWWSIFFREKILKLPWDNQGDIFQSVCMSVNFIPLTVAWERCGSGGQPGKQRRWRAAAWRPGGQRRGRRAAVWRHGGRLSTWVFDPGGSSWSCLFTAGVYNRLKSHRVESSLRGSSRARLGAARLGAARLVARLDAARLARPRIVAARARRPRLSVTAARSSANRRGSSSSSAAQRCRGSSSAAQRCRGSLVRESSRIELVVRRSKHMGIRKNFVQQQVNVGTISVTECSSEEMVADLLTKPVGSVIHRKLFAQLMGIMIPFRA